MNARMFQRRFLVIALLALAGLWIPQLALAATGFFGSQPVDETTKSTVLARLFQTPLHFVANQGQFPEEVVYYAKSEGATVYCTEQGLVFGFAEGSISLKFSEDRRVKPEARAELKGKVNYFIGNDPASWRTDISTFSEVVYRSVYPGIDLVYSGNQRRLKYTFYLHPNADPNQIQMSYEGVERLSVDVATGELIIQTPWGEMRDAAPVAHQEINGIRKKVDISFRLISEKKVGFAIGDYDPNLMLIIDPGYSTYLGGSDSDYGNSVAIDSSGNAYATGQTKSSNFSSQDSYQGSNAGDWDVFVAKFSSSGDTLIYSTYLGGSDRDYGNDVAVDDLGNAYVTGLTASSNFPTQNPYQSNYGGGGYNAFVTKLSNTGTGLIYSTYLGGSGVSGDQGYGIAVDSSGNAYVTGETKSSDFPTKNPYQSSNTGDTDVFVTKFNGNGELIYSTYLGGSNYDYGFGIAVDSSESAYVTGKTNSSNFPTQNPYQDSYAGDYDVFVTKFNSSGNALVYSTYLGGSDADGDCDITVDSSGSAYVTGYTTSSNFPTQNPYLGDTDGFGGGDVFVTKISGSGDTLLYSTYLGGNGNDYGDCTAVDSSGNVYVTGKTTSSDFPTQNPYQSSHGGGYCDAFVTKLSSDGNTITYSTYLGGSGDDLGFSIVVDSLGNAYVTGWTKSSNFPTLNPYQGSNAGNADAFVVSFYSDGSLTLPDITPPATVIDLATSNPTANSITLTWTTPGDDGNTGTASEYDIRYSTTPITDSNWDSATQVTDEPAPQAAGAAESFTVTGLSSGTTYYFAIKTADEVPNWSGLSNIAMGQTLLTDVTSISQVDEFGTRFDRSTGQFSMMATWKNIGATTFYQPLQMVIENITPPTVTVANADGTTPGGKPYYDYSDLVGDGKLDPEETSGTKQLIFNNPSRVRFEFDVSCWAKVGGGGAPGIKPIIGQAQRIHIVIPIVSALAQNYPNPFNPDTWIPYELAQSCDVKIVIYDIQGRLVRLLDLGHREIGQYITKEQAAHWNGRNDAGEAVSSGIYFYQIQAGDFKAMRKMVILK